MQIKILGNAPFQVLATNFSISPSAEGYTLQVSADGVNYSDLFTVGAGVTRMVTGVASGSYYRCNGNQSEIQINWQKQCSDGQGGGGGGETEKPRIVIPLSIDYDTQNVEVLLSKDEFVALVQPLLKLTPDAYECYFSVDSVTIESTVVEFEKEDDWFVISFSAFDGNGVIGVGLDSDDDELFTEYREIGGGDFSNYVRSSDVSNIKTMTLENYEALATKDPRTIYIITDQQ